MKAPGDSGSRRPLALAGGLLTLLASALCVFPTPFLRFLDDKVSDTFVRAGRAPTPTGRVVLVNVDEASLSRYGQWPWPRHRLAALARGITRLEPLAVAVDLTFPEPDRTSLAAVAGEFRRDFGRELPTPDLPADALDHDLAFGQALAGGPFVLAHQFTFAGEEQGRRPPRLHPVAVLLEGGSTERLFGASGAVGSLPVLSGAAAGSGFVNASADADGVLRRVPVLIRYRGSLYPSLALAAAMKAFGQDCVTVRAGPFGFESIAFGNRTVPLDAGGHLLLRYRGPRGTLPGLSAVDVMEGRLPAGLLTGKVAVLGMGATGIIDLRATPLDPAEPGTEIQATAIDNLLAADALSAPWWGRALSLVLVLLAGGLATWICAASLPLWALGLLAACSFAFAWGSAELLWTRRLYVSPVLPTAALWIVSAALIALRTYLAERRAGSHLRRLLLTQDALIQSMATMAERRHRGTGEHIQRTRHYVQALARQLRRNPRFAGALDDATVDLLFRLAPLHDIGKVGIPDQILLKTGRLSEEEFAIMKRHTVYGSETIRHAQEILGEEGFLTLADQFALSHQEKWNGTGYPEGLRGTEIPLAARLMAVADVYDALVSEREYKPAMPHGEAVNHIVRERGVSFDPDVVDAFVAIQDEIAAIATRIRAKPPAG